MGGLGSPGKGPSPRQKHLVGGWVSDAEKNVATLARLLPHVTHINNKINNNADNTNNTNNTYYYYYYYY